MREKINKIKESSGVSSDEGEYGTFNIAFHSKENTNIENGKLVGKLPEFVLKPSIKIGDIIDSRDRKN